MIRHTFLHLPGIGTYREQMLWREGILDWSQFLDSAAQGLVAEKARESAAELLRQSLLAVANGDAAFFRDLLPRREAWRLYPQFADKALFLDIETTGLSPHYDEVTVIGALGGGELALFIKGVNLDRFPAYVKQFPLLVTFNGSQFDVPFLRAHFPEAYLDQAHIDLRFVLGSLGYKGGLKAIERNLGLNRDKAIQAVDGFEAVRLWHRYRHGDRSALEKLLLYNLTDVVNMVELVEIAVREKIRKVAFPGDLSAYQFGMPKLDSRAVLAWLADHLESLGANGNGAEFNGDASDFL
jgi:uncharacterized protein YprB with RNaseH-like and TPR domain